MFLQLFFREKIEDESGYILFVRKNALQILIPKYGLEGTLYLNKKGETNPVTFVYDPEEQTQTCGDVVFRSFDPVVVQLSLDRTNIQHEKLVFKLVKPEVNLTSLCYYVGKIVLTSDSLQFFSSTTTFALQIPGFSVSEDAPKRKLTEIDEETPETPASSKKKEKRKKKKKVR